MLFRSYFEIGAAHLNLDGQSRLGKDYVVPQYAADFSASTVFLAPGAVRTAMVEAKGNFPPAARHLFKSRPMPSKKWYENGGDVVERLGLDAARLRYVVGDAPAPAAGLKTPPPSP